MNNINVGIDIGSYTSKISDGEKIIASVPGLNLLTLREEAEIYFEEPIFSCVIAVPENYSRLQRDDLIINAKKSGFKNIEIISSYEAVLNAIDNKNQKILVYDFGASKSEFIFFNNGTVIKSEILQDICGNEFNKIFASWLRERFSLSLINEKDLIAQAENFKLEISKNNFITWRDVEITREDFERLIYFSIKRASHTAERFIDCYAPEKFIITGGCAEMETVKKIFAGFNPEINQDLILIGAAKHANSLSSTREKNKRLDNAAKLKEIRNELIELEDLLTRRQTDRLYFLFRQVEGTLTNDPASVSFMRNLINEIKTEGAIKNH